MKIFAYHPSRLQACMWMCEKEIAVQVTKSMKKNLVRNNKGNPRMLEWYIYICLLNSQVNNIANYGLFPTPTDKMPTRAPTMTTASKHINTNNTDATKEFKKIFHNHFKEPLSDGTKRTLNAALFVSLGQPVSLWIPFALHYMHLLSRYAAGGKSCAIFKEGNYIGTKQTASQDTPMDNNWLTNENEKTHKINNILDLAIVDIEDTALNRQVILDKQVIAHILFEFKEPRNKEKQDVKEIIAKTESWLNTAHKIDSALDTADEATLFTIDTTKTTTIRVKTPATTKKTKAKVDMESYIHKDHIIEPLSKIGSNLLHLRKRFTDNEDSLPENLTGMPDVVDSLIDDLQQITNNKPIGPFPNISTFLLCHPAPEPPDGKPTKSDDQESSSYCSSDSEGDIKSTDDDSSKKENSIESMQENANSADDSNTQEESKNDDESVGALMAGANSGENLCEVMASVHENKRAAGSESTAPAKKRKTTPNAQTTPTSPQQNTTSDTTTTNPSQTRSPTRKVKTPKNYKY